MVRTLIIGCGNILRGDDAVGPVLIRRLWEMGLPPGVNCADGGTGGMDVAFQMRNVPEVILVDACKSGSEPGAIFQVPGKELEHLPPLTGIHSHAFRWDHALAFGRWLLKEEYPKNITVYLIEGATFQLGDPLSEPVERSMRTLACRIMADMQARLSVEITPQGSLHLSASLAQQYFARDTLLVQVKGAEMWLLPTRGPSSGGLLLKQCTPAGDRSVLIWEHLPNGFTAGVRLAFWDPANHALRVALLDRVERPD
jgi:hydrogenase maturation protease